jgi:hypothetical protein
MSDSRSPPWARADDEEDVEFFFLEAFFYQDGLSAAPTVLRAFLDTREEAVATVLRLVDERLRRIYGQGGEYDAIRRAFTALDDAGLRRLRSHLRIAYAHPVLLGSTVWSGSWRA